VWQSVTQYFYALFFFGCADEGGAGEVEKRKAKKKTKAAKLSRAARRICVCSLLQNYWR
jgi:hypothetical protein